MANNPLDKVYLSDDISQTAREKLELLKSGSSITSGTDTYSADLNTLYLLKNDRVIITDMAPTTATKGYVGQFRIDTINNTTYQCTAITEDVSTNPSTFVYNWVKFIGSTDIATSNSLGLVSANGYYGFDIDSRPGNSFGYVMARNYSYEGFRNTSNNTFVSKATLENVINGKGIIESIRNSGAPTTATVGKLWQEYIDTSTGKTYQCTAIVEDTSTTPSTFIYTWKQLAKVSDIAIYREVNSAAIFPPTTVAFEYPGQICCVQDTRYGRYHYFICRQLSSGSYTWSLLTPNTGTGTDSISLGQDATGTGYGSIAYGAGAHVTGDFAIQIGSGTNSISQTFNVGFGGGAGNYQLLDSNGKIPQDRMRVTKTTMDNVAEVNTEYYLGTQSAVAITMPSTASAGDRFTVDFASGSTATTLTLTGNNIAGDTSFVPEANKLIEMNFKYDGTYWKLLVSSLDTPTGV